MKGSGKILTAVAGLTFLMLMYVHLQISSVIVSFDLHRTTNTFVQRQELLRRLQFNVDQLKAPRLLEEKMKKHELSLGLPNKVEILEVPPVPEFAIAADEASDRTTPQGAGFSKLLGRLIQTAQAKTDVS